jgi:Secretion system C-terminal sorting domain/Bacterial pre-peptidase C-terminal domain/Fibronectin type III domain
MRKQFTASVLLAMLLFAQYVFAQDQALPGKVEVINGTLIKVTEPLRNFKKPSNWVDVPVRDENGVIWPGGKRPAPFVPAYFPDQQQTTDPSLQQNYNTTSNNTERAVGVNINGIGFSSVNPPDPTMCAGPNHIVQMINGNSGALIKIFNKSGGQVLAQTFLDQITGRGGLGDPIALYDQLADRFVMLEFAAKAENANTEGLIIAVSQTPDPTGSWFVYFFGYGTTFPDYPKLSVWNDAYYCTTNDFANASSYTGSSAWAFNRAQMIAGNATAQSQRFTLGNTNKYFSMCPVLLQGTTTPPAGTGGLIAYMADDAWTSSTADVDSIGLLEFKVNFSNAAATTITHKATLATAAYKSDICTATRGRCISQPGSTIALEALQQKVMNQPIYRNFGGFEGIVLTHIVDKGSNISGLRWYELKKTTGNWGITQQSTYAPDNTHRWLPSVCYDKFGNIALAYNVSSSATGVFPGVRYTGRKECDVLNTMTYSEDVIVAGTAANASNRYGDYNHLVADPDGVTFWFTAQWNGASQWSTRITSFTLDECTPAACADPAGLASLAITTTSATVSWGAVSGANSYDVDYKLSSSATWTNAATGTTATSVNLTGLTAATTYDWRVRANCTASSSNYVQAQFTTQSVAVCNTPTGLSSSSITTTGATVNWSAVSGANNYDVDYKLSSSATWTNAATTTISTSVAISGLSASSVYDWRVRANCASGSSAYAQAQFTTSAPPTTCPSSYDNVANGAFSNAQPIPLNTDIKGRISPSADNDYYRFTVTTGGTVSITLTTLPADYDIRIYNNAQSQIAISQNGGTTAETLNLNLAAGNYFARVYGWNGANNATICYTLKVATGTATAPQLNDVFTGKTAVSLFPNPVQQKLSVSIKGDDNTKNILVFDVNGRIMLNQPAMGIITTLDVQKLPAGIYFLKVISQDGALLHQEKFVKQ